jgi:hypothetical protein
VRSVVIGVLRGVTLASGGSAQTLIDRLFGWSCCDGRVTGYRGLELYGGHAAEAASAAATVVGRLDPADDRDGEVLAAPPGVAVEHVVLGSVKNDSIAAFSPADATRPIDPISPCVLRVRW